MLTLTSENGITSEVTAIGTDLPPREQVTLLGTVTEPATELTVAIIVGRPVYLAVPFSTVQ
jgi:hypothetical protein